jgi:hypothetical protein
MRCCLLDVRHALEQPGATLESAAAYLADQDHHYPYKSNFFFSDRTKSEVLENDSRSHGPLARTLRAWDSPLNPGVNWGLANALACVNSYVLLGNTDNHTRSAFNYERWDNLRDNLLAQGDKVSLAGLEAVACYRATLPTRPRGDPYTGANMHIAVYDAAHRSLYVAFRPRSNVLPHPPVFETIPLPF